MNIAYAKIEDMFDLAPFLVDRTENAQELEAGIQSALLDASRLFETETFVNLNFYAPTDGIASDKLIYPNGTMFWRLPPFTEIISVTDSNNELVDTEFYVIDYTNYQLIFKWFPYYCGQIYAPIAVNGKWGFPCVPESVKVAVKNWAGLTFLTNPLGVKGIDNPLTERQENRLRQTYNRITIEWQYKIKRWKNIGIA